METQIIFCAHCPFLSREPPPRSSLCSHFPGVCAAVTVLPQSFDCQIQEPIPKMARLLGFDCWLKTVSTSTFSMGLGPIAAERVHGRMRVGCESAMRGEWSEMHALEQRVCTEGVRMACARGKTACPAA